MDILIIKEVTGRKERIDYYRLERNPAARYAFRCFKMVHEDEEPIVYDTLIDGDSSICTCIGFEQYGYCRHVESLTALIDAGKIS